MAIGTLAGAMIGGSLLGAASSYSSSKNAAAAQENAADQAAATQRYIYDQNVSLTQPQRETGQNALAMLGALSGIGEMPAFGEYGSMNRIKQYDDGLGLEYYYDGEWRDKGTRFGSQAEADAAIASMTPSFETSPGYQFRLGEGMDAINQNAAARGMRLSGQTLKDLGTYAQGQASNEYANYVNQLNALAGLGQTATQSQVASGTNYANAVGQNYLQAGDARASGYAGANSAFQNALGNLGQVGVLSSMGYL